MDDASLDTAMAELQPPRASSSATYSCQTCKRRKVKCDKSLPTCADCQRTGVECAYKAPPPPRRKRKRDLVSEQANVRNKSELLPRLVSSGRTPGGESSGHASQSSAWIGPPPLPTENVNAGSVSETLWNTMGTGDAGQSSEEEPNDHQEERRIQTDMCIYCLRNTPDNSLRYSLKLVDLHPSPETALRIWRLFQERIDPLLRILHRPTTLALLEQAASTPITAEPKDLCLLFAVYHITVCAINERECLEAIGQPKPFLQTMFYDAAKRALAEVDVLRSSNRSTLQAYILFLLSVRAKSDPHLFWMWTGNAMRLGQRMRLHIDGEQSSLSRFHVEMNRRLWWQISAMDGLAGQLSGNAMATRPHWWDTKPPLNVDDEDIWPGMEQGPVPRNGATDMLLVLTRIEAQKLHRIATPSSSLNDLGHYQFAEKRIDEVEGSLEEKYLRFCDWTVPQHALAMILARTSVAATRLRLGLSKSKVTFYEHDRTRLCKLALKVLDFDIAAHNESVLARFRWQTLPFMHWDALMWILTELRRDPPTGDLQEEWAKINALYACHPELRDPKRVLPIAAAKLCCRAWDEYKEQASTKVHTPSFLPSLRAALDGRVSIHKGNDGMNASQLTTSESTNIPAIGGEMGLRKSSTPFDFDYQQMNGLILAGNDGFDVNELDWEFLTQVIENPAAFE